MKDFFLAIQFLNKLFFSNLFCTTGELHVHYVHCSDKEAAFNFFSCSQPHCLDDFDSIKHRLKFKTNERVHLCCDAIKIKPL